MEIIFNMYSIKHTVEAICSFPILFSVFFKFSYFEFEDDNTFTKNGDRATKGQENCCQLLFNGDRVLYPFITL